MKKILYTLLIGIMCLSLSGCVKYDVNMKINADKSMDLNIIYAMDKQLSEDGESTYDEEEIAEMKKQGYDVSKYSDEKWEGLKIAKKIKSIDDVSGEKDVTYDLASLFTETKELDNVEIEEKNNIMFKVEKGIFKNKYTAKFTLDLSSSMSAEDFELDESDFESEDEIIDVEEEVSYNSNYNVKLIENEIGAEDHNVMLLQEDEIPSNEMELEEDEMDMSEFNDLLGNMSSPEISFSVNLPYGSLKNNATSTKNNERELTWTLDMNEVANIEFEFEMANMTNILILLGSLFLIIIVLIIILISKKKKNN